MVYMGSGPSVSFVMRGEVFRGVSGRAGAFGHVTLHAADGAPCACGGRGCVDLHCAPADTVAAVEAAIAGGESCSLAQNELFPREHRADRFDLVKQAALAGDAVATRELERTMRWFGHGIVMLLSIFDVGVVVLGGWGFRRVAELYRDRIQAILREHGRANVEVRISATDDPSAIGGAALALHVAFAPRLNGLVPRDKGAGVETPR
jgi:predicted NBD/HSP70 family sugar kinase